MTLERIAGLGNWLIDKPASVVLLSLILFYGVPQIQSGYEVLDERHRAERAEFRAEILQMREDAKVAFERLGDTIQENTDAIDELSYRLETHPRK